MVSELEDVACLGDWRYVRCLFVEVVFLCLWFLMLVVDVLPHVHTPVVEVLGIPFVGQQVVVPFSVGGVVLDGVGLELLHGGVLGDDLAGCLVVAEVFHGHESHVASDDDVLALVRVDEQLSEVEHFGVVLDALEQFLEMFVTDKPWVFRQSFNLSLVCLNL